MNIKKLNPLKGAVRQELLGIEFGGSNIKLAHVGISAARSELISLNYYDIAGLPDSELSKVIKSCFDEFKVKERRIINIVPAHVAITKNIEIPSTDTGEIREIINLQAGRHTPYSREEIIIDYINLGAHKHNYTKILLVIVARSVIKRQLDILDRAGLKTERVLFAPEGLGLFITKILGAQNNNSVISTLNVDDLLTSFSVVSGGRLLFSRSIPIGTQHLSSEREKHQARFVEELRKSLEAYQNEDIDKIPNTVFLTGVTQELKHLESAINSNLHLPASVVPYLEGVVIPSQSQKLLSLTSRASFLNVIAPLSATGDMKVDLIPEEVKLRASLEERGRDLIRAGIFIITAFVIIFSILLSKIYFKAAYLNLLKKKFDVLDKEANKLEKDFSVMGLIKSFLLNRGFSLEVLTELHTLTPVELAVSNIRFDGQGKFSVTGTSASMSTVFSLVDNMEKSKYFRDVKTKYTTKRKDGSRDVTDFEITASVEKPAD